MFPAILQAASRTIHVEWQHSNTSNIAGFRLYHEINPVCEIIDPKATSLDCAIDLDDGETWFTMTAFLSDGTESPHSEIYDYTVSSNLQAVISTEVQEGDSPLLVEFNAIESTGNISSYEWMFGDGGSSSGSITSHTYTSAGVYTATLTVTDETGATDQESVVITVTNPSVNNTPPTAHISTTKSVGVAPLLVELNASNSKDSDGAIISYSWDLGDGENATGALVSHTYTTPGTYNPTLTVTDDGGLTDTISIPIVVESTGNENIPPTAVISVTSKKGKAPLKVTFSAESSKDPDGTVSFCTWHFGDGSTSTQMTTTHTFSQPGKYTVTLCVTDDSGANSELVKAVINVQKQSNQPVKTANIIPILEKLLLDDKE